MKQILLVAVLASLASSALTLLAAGAFRTDPFPVPSSSASPSAADFKAALADLEREVAALRRDLAGAEAGPPPALPPGAAAAPPPRGPGPSSAPVVREAKSAEVPVAPPESLRRFVEILPRSGEGERDREGRKAHKRRWILRGEREVLEWFGIPDTISGDGEQETWSYEIPTGAVDEEGYPETRSFWIQLSRGRLVEIGD